LVGTLSQEWKTFCSLYPEYAALTALIVSGKTVVKSVLSAIDEFKSIASMSSRHSVNWRAYRVKDRWRRVKLRRALHHAR